MPFEKGHKVNLGSDKVGRKTIKEELAMYKKKIKQIAMEELAASKVYGHLKTIQEKKDRQGVKEIALPIYLKSKADKHELSGLLEVKQIIGMIITKDEVNIQD